MAKDKSNGPPVPATETTARPNMLEWLANATAADLAEIDQAIALVEDRIAVAIGELRGELSSLQALRRVVDVKVNGPKPKRPKKKPATASDSERGIKEKLERRRRIAELLSREGPMLALVIANRLELDGRGVGGMLQCDWFESTSQGYRLTSIGRREALGA